jgi:hypothetical protein
MIDQFFGVSVLCEENSQFREIEELFFGFAKLDL